MKFILQTPDINFTYIIWHMHEYALQELLFIGGGWGRGGGGGGSIH